MSDYSSFFSKEAITIVKSFPAVDPIAAIVLSSLIPLLSFLFIYLRTRKRHKFLDWRLTLAIYLDDNSSRVALRTLILTLLLGINQISYAYQRGITFNYNPLYYAQVTSATQDNINAISISGTESFATYSSASSSRRLVELSENEYIPDHSFPDHTRRRLNGYSNSFVAVVYHTSDYSNLLTTANLKAICQTEKSFLNNVGCFNPSSIKSIIPSIFWNNTCVAKQFNPEAVFTSFQNEPYLQDNINYVNPTSNVVISYFDSNSCDSYSYSSFQSLLSSYTKAPIQVTFVNTHFINTQFQDITTGAYSVTGIALLITVGFLIFGLRGLLMTIAIFYTMAVAFVTAIGVLPYANYQYFSMYNIISVYMMIALGGSTMLLYGSAWRRTFPVDASITGRRILKSYQLISMAIMFVFLLAFITFVSKISSSIVVLSQLGVFLTVSYVTFFIQLHTFLIPLWISLSAYKVFPDHYRSLFEEYCEIQIVHDYGKDDFYSEGDDDDAYEELPYGEGDWEGYSQYTGSQRSPSRQPSLRVIQQSGKSGVGQVSGKSEYSTTGPRLGRDRQPIQGSHREDSLSRDTHIAIMRSLSEIDTTFKGVGSPSTVPSTNPSPDLNTSPVPNSSASIRRLSAKNSETTFEETKNGQSRKDTSPKRRASFAADESLVVEYSCADVTITEPPKNSVLRASSVSSVRAGSSVHSGATQSVRRSSLASVESLSNAIGGNPNRRMSTMTQAQSVVGFDDDVNDPRDEAKAIARYFGILSALIWLVLMVVVSAAGYARIQVSYDIPSIVSPSTNLGQAIFINQNYKLGLLVDYSDPQNMPLISTLSPSVEPSASPIQSPTVFPAGSRSPTTKPVISNQPSSLKPTAVPTSRHPSARPVAHSGAPSTAPSQSGIQSTSLQAQSYVMTGCYGISTSKPFVDVQVNIESDPVSFLQYSLSDALFNQLAQVCNYVETNRNSLYISTQWVYQRDCISDQLVKANQTLSALSADDLQSFLLPYWGAYAKQDLYVSAYWNQVILLYWASTFGQESFLGVEGVTFKSPYLEVLAPITMPVWICANFSMQDPSKFTIQNNLVNTRIKTWNSIFSSPTAIQSNVNSIVGSPYFSSFIFESAVSSSVALGAVASIFGFIALVVIFTQNISSTVICTLSLFSICLITVAIKLGTISNTFDLYDGIVLVTLFALFANFPMHFFFHFFNDSDHLRILYYKTEDYEDEFDLLWNLPNSLMYTARYSLRAFLVPFLMMVAVGGYLMTSELIIIQRSGEYLVIISVVSFVYTLSLFPFSLALSVRLAKYDIDYDEKISNAQMFVSEQCGLGSQWVTNSINSMIAALHTALMCCIPTRQATKTAQSDKHRADRSKKIEIVRNRDDNNRDEGSVNGEEGEPFALDIDEMDDEFDESPVHVTTSGKMFSQSGKMFGSPALHAQRSNRSLGSTKNFGMSPRSASVGAGGGSSKKAHPIRAHMHGRDRNLVLLELNAFNLERYTREVTKKEGTLSDAKHASASETKSSGGKEIEKDTVESLPFAMKRFLESSVQSKQNMTTTKPQLKKSSSQRIRERFAEIDEETKQVNSVNKTLREQGNEESTVRHPTTAMSLFEASFLLPMRIITASDTPIVALKSTERKNTIDENIKMKRTTTEVQTSMNSLFAFMSPRSADAAKLKRFADSFKDDVDSSHEVDMDPDTQAYTNANATNSTAAVLNNDINHSQSNTKSPRGSTLMKLFERSFLSTSPRPVNNSDVMKPTDNLKSTDVESSAKYAVIPTADAASLPTESTSVEMSVVEKNNEVDSLMQPDGESTVLSDHEQM